MNPEPTDFPWLKDDSKAAQFLAHLIIGSSAQAYLITRNGEVWAYAGQLSDRTVNEVVQIINENWDDQKNEELLRFVNLRSTTTEYLLYATKLIDNMILALVFDYDTPFSAIRSQALNLTDTMLGKKSLNQAEQARVPKASGAPAEAAWEQSLTSSTPSNVVPHSPAPHPNLEAQEELPEDSHEKDMEWRVAEHEGISRPEARPSEVIPASPGYREQVGVPADDISSSQDYSEAISTESQEVGEPSQVETGSPSRVEPPEIPDVGGRVRPIKIEASGSVTFKPALYDFYPSYACLLVPRFSSHRLTGTLANRLSEWLPNVCIAFGWRLDYLAIRPEYLQWIVKIPPATSLDVLTDTVREQTSSKIFFEFTGLQRENPSGDFWAPGYLIVGGSKPLAPEVVRNYITQIRQQQGISNFR
jgi:REP element-mobilizing transposase RayT